MVQHLSPLAEASSSREPPPRPDSPPPRPAATARPPERPEPWRRPEQLEMFPLRQLCPPWGYLAKE